MIITCSPSDFNDAESLSTIRFGNRAKKVKNKAKINKEQSSHELKQKIEKLTLEIKSYKQKLKKFESLLKDKNIEIPEFDAGDENSHNSQIDYNGIYLNTDPSPNMYNTSNGKGILRSYNDQAITIYESKEEDTSMSQFVHFNQMVFIF